MRWLRFFTSAVMTRICCVLLSFNRKGATSLFSRSRSCCSLNDWMLKGAESATKVIAQTAIATPQFLVARINRLCETSSGGSRLTCIRISPKR